MSAPEVSVVIPTYNRSAWLGQAIRSVLAQTYPGFELVVVDNASADNTPVVVSAFADSRVRYVRHDRNIGMVPNWNAGIRHAQGRYVALLEDDNWWDPQYLARTVPLLEGRPDLGFAYTAAYLTDTSSSVRQLHRRWDSDRTVAALHDLQDLMRGNKILLSTVLVRRACLDLVGLFDEAIPYAADWEMWMRLALRYSSAYIAAPLAFYRQHATSGTAQIHAMPYALFFDHRMIVDKTLRQVRATHGQRLAEELQQVAYRWLVEVQADRARKWCEAAEVAKARGEALLALRCDVRALFWSAALRRVLVYSMLPPPIAAALRSLWRRARHSLRRFRPPAFRGLL
jgi:glycosyltransferase involved in cell wall biosynthesis